MQTTMTLDVLSIGVRLLEKMKIC